MKRRILISNPWTKFQGVCQLLAASAILCANANAGVSGQPDTSLNGTGFKILEYRTESKQSVERQNWNQVILDAYLEDDGNILVLGISKNIVTRGDSSFSWEEEHDVAVIARYNEDFELLSDGVTDNRFINNSGIFTPNGNHVIIRSDIVYPNKQLKQFNLDGSLNTLFASGGTFTDANNLTGDAMRFDREGRLMMYNSSNGLTRLLANGSPDPTFGEAGTSATPESGSGVDVIQADDGAYYVIVNNGNILRYLASGGLDTNFGNEGVLDSVTSSTRVSGLAPMPDNGVVTLVNNSQGTSAKLVHFGPDGSIVSESAGLSESLLLQDGTHVAQLGYGRGANLYRLEDDRILISVNWQGTTPAWQVLGYQLFGLFNPDLTRDSSFDGDNGLILNENIYSVSNQLPVTRRKLMMDHQGRILMVTDFGSFNNDNISNGMAAWGVIRLMGSSDGNGGGQTTENPLDNQDYHAASTGWRRSSWLGDYFAGAMESLDRGWIFHRSHGWRWIQPTGMALTGFFIYDPELGWLWTRQDFYPYAYSPVTGWHPLF